MAQKFKVYQGYHSQELLTQLTDAWSGKQPLIVAPPHLKDVQPPADELVPNNCILGVYTSGTLSGRPRLILYTRANIEASLQAINRLFDLKRVDKIFCYPQPTHTFGLTLGYIQGIINSKPVEFVEGPYGRSVHQKWIENVSSGMLTLGTPTHLIDLIHFVKANNLIPPHSYSAIIGGAPVSKKLWSDMRDILNIEAPSVGYGATEASPGVSHLPPGVEPAADGDIGFVLPTVQMSAVSENGYTFSGPNVCAAIIEDGKLITPREVVIKDYLLQRNGRFIFQGRSDLLINRGGLKLSPEVIESTLTSHMGLKAVCVPIYSERLGEDIGFVIQKDTENINSSKDLIESVQKLIKDEFSIQISAEHIVVFAIPMNPNAKYDRTECLKLVLNKKVLKTPIATEYLKQFMPHRAPAIWIDRIIQFTAKSGVAEVDLDVNSNIFTNRKLRESACIELVAQTYGYAKVAYEISAMRDENSSQQKAKRTLIAEIRNAEFQFNEQTDELIQEAIAQKIPLIVQAVCTHDFGLIKVIRGDVQLKNQVLATLSLKAFVSGE